MPKKLFTLLLLFLLGSAVYAQKVYVTKSGKKYHSSNCKHLNKSKIEIDLKEAKDKLYEPCNLCFKDSLIKKETTKEKL